MTVIKSIEQFDIMDNLERMVLADHLAIDLGREQEAEVVRTVPVMRDSNGKYYERPESGSHTMPGWEDWHPLVDEIDLDQAEWCNQEECYGDGTSGQFFIADDYNCVLYWGYFGDNNSPGCSGCTFAEVYETRKEYEESLAEWRNKPEWI